MKIALFFLLILFQPVSAELLITEVFPNPPGNEKGNEFIRIFNPSFFEINLSSYQLFDAQNNTMQLDGILDSNYSRQIFPNFSLNNNEEKIFLVKGNATIDIFSYRSAKENKTLKRKDPRLSLVPPENIINTPAGIIYTSKNKKLERLAPYFFAIFLVFLLISYKK